MTIAKIKTSIKTTQIDALIKQIITAYRESSLQKAPYLPALMSELETLSTTMSASFTRDDVESTLQEKDALRDDAVQGFYHFLKGATYHPDVAVKESAEALLKIVDINITRLAYGAESSMIDTLLEKLGSPENSVHCAAIPGVAPLVERIASTQKEFFDTSVAYETDKGELKTTAAPSTIKKEILAHCNGKVVLFLRAMAVVDDATFGSFCRTSAALIESGNRA